MSHQAHSWVCLLPPDATTDGEFRILSHLANHTSKYGLDCWPSLELLIERTGFQARTIELALEAFRRVDWYHRVNGRRRGVGPLVNVPMYLDWLRKSCGKPVDDLHQRSLFEVPRIVEFDPVCRKTAASPSAHATSPSDQSVISHLIRYSEEEGGARAPHPPPETSHVTTVTDAEKQYWLAHLRELESRFRSSPDPVRPSRRSRWAARRPE
jgi:hypothetical protein